MFAVTCVFLYGVWHVHRALVDKKWLEPWLVLAALGAFIVTLSPAYCYRALEKFWIDPVYRLRCIGFLVPLIILGGIFVAYGWFPSNDACINKQPGSYDAWINNQPGSYFIAAVTGLCTTIFGLFLFDVFFEPYVEMLKGAEREDFDQFFGRSCLREGIAFVHAKRELDRKRLKDELMILVVNESERRAVNEIVDRFSDYPFKYSRQLPPEAEKSRPEGVTSWVASEDIGSAAALAQLFARVGMKEEIEFLELDEKMIERIDEELKKGGKPVKCFVSFGLGFNLMTNTVKELFDKKPRDGPLSQFPFDVDYTKGSLAGVDQGLAPDFRTDNIVRMGELLTPPTGKDYAIIVRVVQGDGKHAYFICAGRTAYGTTAAGIYLANHWRDLKGKYDSAAREAVDGRRVRPETHSLLAIVEHQFGTSYGGKIATDPDKGERIHFEMVKSLLPQG